MIVWFYGWQNRKTDRHTIDRLLTHFAVVMISGGVNEKQNKSATHPVLFSLLLFFLTFLGLRIKVESKKYNLFTIYKKSFLLYLNSLFTTLKGCHLESKSLFMAERNKIIIKMIEIRSERRILNIISHWTLYLYKTPVSIFFYLKSRCNDIIFWP